ncbi:MAG: PP0621 family protein [Pusillimonas sp.]
MGKVLFWVIVIIGGLLAARLMARYHERGQLNGTQPRQVKQPDTAGKSAEAMVRCEHCGIHLPRSEAVLSNGRIWCSQEHARLQERQ